MSLVQLSTEFPPLQSGVGTQDCPDDAVKFKSFLPSFTLDRSPLLTADGFCSDCPSGGGFFIPNFLDYCS